MNWSKWNRKTFELLERWLVLMRNLWITKASHSLCLWETQVSHDHYEWAESSQKHLIRLLAPTNKLIM